jgi:hypothetical protein
MSKLARSVSRSSTELTPIGKLWQKRNDVIRQQRAVDREYSRIHRLALLQAGVPDPSITYSSKESRALGIEWNGLGAPPSYIEPRSFWSRLTVEQREALHEGRFSLMKKQAAKEKKRKQLLEISRQYDEEFRRIEREMGGDAVDKRRDTLVEQQCRLEDRILQMPSNGLEDLKIKLTLKGIYGGDNNGRESDSIVCDVQRLMKRPEALAQVFAQI